MTEGNDGEAAPLLDAVRGRVLGSLMEKQQTTPEYYPMTLNALVAACNQRTSREPVTDYTSDDVQLALQRLQEQQLVWQIHGGRSVRWEHNLEKRLGISPEERALLTLLLLRGAQTPGELRSRSERLYNFTEVAEVETVLRRLAERQPPFVAELQRRPGQKETRWRQLLSPAAEETIAGPAFADTTASGTVPDRLTELERRVEILTTELQRLKEKLGES